jgi:hypothetical protein
MQGVEEIAAGRADHDHDHDQPEQTNALRI